MVPSRTAFYMKGIRASAKAAGRDPNSIKSFPKLSPFIAPTLEEAQAGCDSAAMRASPEGGLAKFCSYTNLNPGGYQRDEPFDFAGGNTDNAIQGIILSFKERDRSGEV